MPCSPESPIRKPGRRLSAEQQQLVLDNHTLAPWALKRYFARHLSRRLHDDLGGVAYLALCDAAWYFDPARGKFSTLAVLMIRQAVSNYLERDARAGVDCQALTGGLDPDICALDRSSRAGGGRGNLVGLPWVYDTAVDRPFHADEVPEKALNDAVRRLPNLGRWLVRRHFRHGMSLGEIGALIAARKGLPRPLSRERVRQLLAGACERLRALLEGSGYRHADYA